MKHESTGYTEAHAGAKVELPELAAWPNQHAGKDYWIDIVEPEFTCVCPKTGLPDFARLRIRYLPGELCVELKSLKLYLQAFRNVGIFHENAANRIQQDLEELMKPRKLLVDLLFNPRGGIITEIRTGDRPEHDAHWPDRP